MVLKGYGKGSIRKTGRGIWNDMEKEYPEMKKKTIEMRIPGRKTIEKEEKTKCECYWDIKVRQMIKKKKGIKFSDNKVGGKPP